MKKTIKNKEIITFNNFNLKSILRISNQKINIKNSL